MITLNSSCQCTHKRTVSGNRCTDCHLPVGQVAPRTAELRDGDKNYSVACTVCGEKPTVHPRGLCGPCWHLLGSDDRNPA